MSNFKVLFLICTLSAIVLVSCQKDDDVKNIQNLAKELYGVYVSDDGNFTLEIGDTTFIVNGMNYYHQIKEFLQNENFQSKFSTNNGVEHDFSIAEDGSIQYKFITPFGSPTKNYSETKGLGTLVLKTAAKKIIKYGASTAGCRDTKGLDIGNNKLYVLAKLSNFHYDVISIKLREDGSLPLDPEDPDLTQYDSTTFAADAAGPEGSDVVFQENGTDNSSEGDYLHVVKKSLGEIRSYFSRSIDQGATNGVTTHLATGVGVKPRQGASANQYTYLNSNDKMIYVGKFRPDGSKDKIGKVKIKNNNCDQLHGLCIEPNEKNLLFVSCSDKDGNYWIESYTISPTSDKNAKSFTFNGMSQQKTNARNYQQLICDGSIVYALSNHQGHTLDIFDLNLNKVELEDNYALQDYLDEMQLADFKSSDMAVTQNSLYISNGDENSDEERRIIMMDLIDYSERAGVSADLSGVHIVKLTRQ